jgi:hypothetical protein
VYYIVRVYEDGSKKFVGRSFNTSKQATDRIRERLQDEYETAMECGEIPPGWRYRVVFMED